MADVAHEFLLEVFDRREDASRDDIALDLGEPELDLVQPRRVGRREMQAHRRMGLQKFGDPRGLVRREIVRNHMDLHALGLIGHEVRQERDELLEGVALRRLAQHLARLGIERGVEGERAVPVIFEAMPFRPPRRQGQHRTLAVQGLDRRFLVHTKHRRMLRWVQIEADDVSGLALEVRVGGSHIALQPMGLDPMLRPDSRHPHMADPELGRQLAGAPVRRAVGRRPPCGLQDAGFHLRSVPQGSLPAMTTIQPGQPLSGKPLAPGRHKAAATPQGVTHGIPGRPLSQEQNHAGSPSGFGSPGAAPRSSGEFHSFPFRQDHRVLHEHEYSL